MTRVRLAILLAVLGTVAMLAVAFRPQAEEVEDNEPPTVSESDLQLYIDVYSAMQEDHDLTIDNAIKPHSIALEDFRDLERRIQGQPRLVERVRQALLEHAKAHSVFAQSTGSTPTPAGTATAPPQHPRKKKK